MGRGVVGGRGAKSYDGEKAWSRFNHSILSAALLHFTDPDLIEPASNSEYAVKQHGYPAPFSNEDFFSRKWPPVEIK
jgi:hypothetical protein